MHFFAPFCGAVPCADRSFMFLRLLQYMCGQFIGYQVAMDIGYHLRGLYAQDLVSDCGPGAASVLSRIFKGVRTLEGMQG